MNAPLAIGLDVGATETLSSLVESEGMRVAERRGAMLEDSEEEAPGPIDEVAEALVDGGIAFEAVDGRR